MQDALETNIFDGNKEMLGMTIRLSKSMSTANSIEHVKILTPLLAFHDCVGGCNGAINPDDHENTGLEVIAPLLEDVYQGFTDVMSRADFWAYAGYVAIWNGIQSANRGCPRADRKNTYCLYSDIDYTFEWGREVC